MDQKAKIRDFLSGEPNFEGFVGNEYLPENTNNKPSRETPRGRSRGRGKDRGGRGRGGYFDHDESEGEGSKQSLSSNQGYNFMAELESYKACKTQERRQGSQDGTQGRARSVSSERSTSSFKSTNNPKPRTQEHTKHEVHRSGDTYPIEKWKQMVLNMALKLNISNKETKTDCYFYYYATCSKDTSCPFRHEPGALKSRATCQYWREGKCRKQICTYRHMEMEHNQKRGETMCWFETQPGGCQRPTCSFKHKQKKDNFGQDEEYLGEEDDPNVPEGNNANTSAFAHQEESNLNSSMGKKVDNFLEMFRATLTSPNKVGGNMDESSNQENSSLQAKAKLEAGEILDDKPTESLLGSPPNLKEGNGISKPLDPAIEVIRKRLMEPPGIEKRVEEFLAAIRITIAPPRQQPGLRKSMADRLSFKNRPQTLSLTEMKYRINSLKNNQQQQQFSDFDDEEADDRIMYQPEYTLQFQFCDLACIKPATLPKCLTRKSLPLQIIQKTAAMANQGRGRGRGRGTDNKDVGHGRGGMQLGSQVELKKGKETFESQAHDNVSKECGIDGGNVVKNKVGGSSTTEVKDSPKEKSQGVVQDSEQSMSEEKGTGKVEVENEKECLGRDVKDKTCLKEKIQNNKSCLGEDEMEQSDASRGQDPPHSPCKGAPKDEGKAPKEAPKVPGLPFDAPKDNSTTPPNTLGEEKQPSVKEQHCDSKLQNDNKLVDDKSSDKLINDKSSDKLIADKSSVPKSSVPKSSVPKSSVPKSSVPKSSEEKQPLVGDLSDQKRISDIPSDLGDQKKLSEIPDTKLSDEKKPLLEMPPKTEDKNILPVKAEIFSLIHSARLGQPTSDKDVKPSDKPDGVEDKKDILPKIDDKMHLGIGPTPSQDPRDQWLEEARYNERLWDKDESWKYDSPDKYMAQSSSGRAGNDRRWSPGIGDLYDYNHRNDSFRDRGAHDEYRYNYDQDWGPNSGPSRDWRYNRSNQGWGDERGIDPKWDEERSSSRIWDDRRERSPSRERGILGAAPGVEEGILGAPPENYFDRFAEKISAKKKDWGYNDPEFRDWSSAERAKESLNEVGLRDQWNESYSKPQEWGPPRDWSPGRFPERDIRNWGPGSVSESYRGSGRREYGNISPARGPDIRGRDLAPRWSPVREDSLRMRLDGRSPCIGNFPVEQPSPGRRETSRGRSPLPSSEIKSWSPSKAERLSSPTSSGRNPTAEASTPVPSYGHKNKSQLAVCVKNLPLWTDEQSLKNVLSFEYNKYGQVTRVDITGTATERYAVVSFRKHLEAQEAVFDSRNKVIFGQTITVSLFDGELPLEEPKVYAIKSDYDYSQLLVGYKGEEFEALRSILEVHKKECLKYREQPSSHPQYNKEYHIFCLEKQSKILSLGGDPTQYDILPEWKAYWPRRLEELFAVSWQSMKKQCLGSLVNKKELSSKKSSSSSSKKNRRSPSPPRSDKSSRRKHRSSHSKSHVSSSRHREKEKSRSRRRRSSSRTSTESSSTPRRDRHTERHTDKRKKSRRKRERSSSPSSSSSNERSESKNKTQRKKEKRELPGEDAMEDGEIRDDLESNASALTSAKKYGKDTQKGNYQEFIKQRMSDVLGHVPESERNKSETLKETNEKSRKKKSKFPNEVYPYTTDGSPKVKKNYRENFEGKVSKLVPYEAEDDQEQTSKKKKNLEGGGALGAIMAQYSEPSSSGATASGSTAISPLKICGNIITIIDILSVADETVSSVAQPLKDLYKQAMEVQSNGADPTEVFKDGKAAVNLTSCKLAILAESGTISKSNRKLYQEAQENIDKLMKVDQHFVEGINIERISKKTMDMNVSEAIQYIRKELINNNPSANVSEDKVMNLYMEIKKRHLMYLSA